jgi:hypothetical protein
MLEVYSQGFIAELQINSSIDLISYICTWHLKKEPTPNNNISKISQHLNLKLLGYRLEKLFSKHLLNFVEKGDYEDTRFCQINAKY